MLAALASVSPDRSCLFPFASGAADDHGASVTLRETGDPSKSAPLMLNLSANISHRDIERAYDAGHEIVCMLRTQTCIH